MMNGRKYTLTICDESFYIANSVHGNSYQAGSFEYNKIEWEMGMVNWLQNFLSFEDTEAVQIAAYLEMWHNNLLAKEKE